MSFPGYPTYKDSGVEWLGQVPAHWNVRKLRDLARIESGHTPSRQHPEYWVDDECVIPWFTLADVGYLRDPQNTRVSTTSQRISPRGMENSAARLLPSDTVILSRTASVGFSGITTVPLAVSQDFAAWICGPELRPAYLLLCLRAMRQEFRRLMMGSTHQTIYMPDIIAFRVPVPPIFEQTAIAAFLDHETAKIDALVAEQQRLVELLKEKRQAIISHAVTKGLNPDVPMKDSGVEWLGEVPEHWDTCCIKHYCASITDGAHISPTTEGGVVPFVSTKDVVNESIDFDGCLRTTSESFEYMQKTGCRPLHGDVLFSKDGTIGRTAVVDDDREFAVASSLIILRPRRNALVPRFLSRLCQSSGVVWQVESFVKGAGLPRLSIQNLLKVVGCFPPVKEQSAIAAFLDREATTIDTLTAEAERAIALLQERRTALISAAVTGQIDVRALAPEAA